MTEASAHTVSVVTQYNEDGEEITPEVTFACSAEVGDACRRDPDCDCEELYLGDSTDDEGHQVVDQDCWVVPWFDAEEHRYDGPDADELGDWCLPRDCRRSGPVVVYFDQVPVWHWL